MGRKGFTLVELLVVIGIITVVVAILLPMLSRARAAADLTVCQSNIHQVLTGLAVYTASNKGYRPPNTSVPAKWWSDADRLGHVLTPNSTSDLRGPAVTCPTDDGAVRTYAMNVWAGSQIDNSLSVSNTGKRWANSPKLSSQLILITEAWSGTGSAITGWASTACIGNSLLAPGRRFGGGLGAPSSSGRFGLTLSQLAYARHRLPHGQGTGTQPIGAVNIGFLDGHVERMSNDDLYNAKSGHSTLRALWCPDDAVFDQ